MYRRIFYTSIILLCLASLTPTTRAQTSTRGRAAENPDKQTFASMVGQRMSAYLQNIRSSLERSPGLSDPEKKRFSERIAKDISSLQGQTAAIGRAQDQRLLKQRMQELRDSWTKLERRVKQYVGVILSNHIRFAIERLERITEKIDLLINRLPDEYQNKEKINELRQKFADELTAARDTYTAAQGLFDKLESTADSATQDIFKQGQDTLKEAHTHLRAARETFRMLLQALKQTLPHSSPDTPSTTAPTQP